VRTKYMDTKAVGLLRAPPPQVHPRSATTKKPC
jgi:hypothetical protein